MSGQNKRAGQNIQLASLDELFGGGTAAAINTDATGITELPISELYDFKDHPFKVIPDDESMLELIESIKENGIIQPLEVRPRSDKGHEVIAGHRRKYAAAQAGLTAVPCYIHSCDDDTAIERMVDSNLYRPEILPSEKAFAYKMKLEAMNRQGKKTDTACVQNEHKTAGKKSRDILAEKVGTTGAQVQRFIRLTYLSRDLLDLVDAGKIAVNFGAVVSHLEEMQQIWLYEFIRDQGLSVSPAQAAKLKQYQENNELTKKVMELALTEGAGTGPSISLKTKDISKYFPPNTDKKEMQETILKLLENWTNNRAV